MKKANPVQRLTCELPCVLYIENEPISLNTTEKCNIPCRDKQQGIRWAAVFRMPEKHSFSSNASGVLGLD